jgi:predicted RND superfamily exporter protein
MRKILTLNKPILVLFIVFGLVSAFFLTQLRFSFDFSQFFPEGDEDLIFYQEFIKDFGVDDSFMLVAVENKGGVFEKDFLERFHEVSVASKKLPFVTQNQSLTTLFYPLKTSFGYSRIPIINLKDSTRYAKDWEKIEEDGLFINTLIDENASSLVLSLETEDQLDYAQSITFLTALRALLKKHGLEKYHLIGRTYFYESLIEMQKTELIKTTISGLLLVFIVLLLVYKRTAVILIALSSIMLALLLFLGILSMLGKELTSLAAFYPILMLIVGTSDVIHIMDDYLGKIASGIKKREAMYGTLNEVGVSTLLTSLTTAIGFASLLTSKSSVVSNFGMDAALGVLVAFITIIGFTCSLLLLVKKEKLLSKKKASTKWKTTLGGVNLFTQKHAFSIGVISLLFLVVCFYGMTKINTNYQIRESLPKGSQIAADFEFFQKNFSGFRPLQVAVISQGTNNITDFEVIQEIEKVEQKLSSLEPIKSVQSVTAFYKGLHKANHLNKSEFFVLPEKEETFEKYHKELKKLARRPMEKFVSPDGRKSRITGTVLDIGLDSIQTVYADFNNFVRTKIDTSLVKFRLTGTGILLDKNSFYVKESLIQGLLMGLILVALIMALIYKNVKLIFISLFPNLIPLVFAAALIGFLGIPLEATIAVVFAIVFGIAVDDTIHFLGRYKVCLSKGMNKEEALNVTFNETGRALIITTMILFFGFMVLLFSIHLPSITIGLLVSVTLLTALAFDLLLLPVLIRKFL